MEFNPCPHQITQIVLRAGKIIRQLKGLPEEKNVTILYGETAPLLGIIVAPMDSRIVNHLPSPAEMKDEKGRFVVPRKECSKCGGIMVLGPICPSCKDSEDGKYKSGYKCEVKTCEYVDDKSEKFFIQRLNEMGVEIPTGPKRVMGIKTLTDEGLK